MNSVSDEIVEQWRAEFENSFEWPNFERYESNRHYKNGFRQAMWQGFLMARQSVSLNLFGEGLIENCFGTSRSFSYIEVERLIKVIEAQGYAVGRE